MTRQERKLKVEFIVLQYLCSIEHVESRKLNKKSFLLTASSSTSTVRNKMEGYLSAISQYTGAIVLQGPHHNALKFTTTCLKQSKETNVRKKFNLNSL